MVKKRNLLCVKARYKLTEEELLLYKPYKTILQNFIELATEPHAIDFDPVSKAFDGLLSAPQDVREYYEALLGVTSYYQHSKGGKGKYIEKKIASAFDNCSLDIKLSELPIWLAHPLLHRRRAIFTSDALKPQEKSALKQAKWDWIGEKDITLDIGVLFKSEGTVVFAEVKNRIDSGGVAGRREVLTSQKFGLIVNYLLSGNKIFKRKRREFSLSEFLDYFHIKSIELYLGILFDREGRIASLEIDKRSGFYLSNREGFDYLKRVLENREIPILTIDLDNLLLEFEVPDSPLKVKVEVVYGDDVMEKLFRKHSPFPDLLLLKYDDIWFSQLITIEERTLLLRYGKNFTTNIIALRNRDENIRAMINRLINSECQPIDITRLCNYLLMTYPNYFEDILLPKGRDKEEYIGDILQLICASEA